jgi:hypothetical protein
MKKVVVSLLVGLAFMAISAETHLSGEIQSTSFDASGNPYLVDKDIIVPTGKTLTIKEGCVFLFSGFSGLNVFGNLAVEGSTQNPVIFTCVYDGDFNRKSQQLPNPFDWNGIIIAKESGSAHFQNFQLRYSVYGIKSQNTAMTVQNGIFRQNGQFHFTMNDKIQYVQDNISYSYNATTDSDKKGGEMQPGPGATSQKTGASSGRKIIRYTSLGLGVVGLVAGTIFALKAASTSKDLDDATAHPDPNVTVGNAKWKDLNNDLNSQKTLATIFFVVGGAGLLGFTATFVF